MSTWYPISTAPKGRPIDVWSDLYGHVPWCVAHEFEFRFIAQHALHDGIDILDATHWRPSDYGPGMEEGEVRWMVEGDGGFGITTYISRDVALHYALLNARVMPNVRVVRVRIVREEG